MGTSWAAGEWWYVYSYGDNSWYYLQNHELKLEVISCAQDGSVQWKPYEGLYDDNYYDIDGNPL